LRARERLRDYLRLYCGEQRAIDDLVLCVEEAATNAIRHSGTTKDIEISLEFEGERLVASVKDLGRGFDVATFDPDREPDPFEDHGRGLFIIAALMDELELRVDGGLEVHMTRRAPRRGDDAVLESGLGEPRASDDLSHVEARLRAMLEEIDEAFVALDWEYRYVHVNEAMLRFTRTTRDELLGRVLWEVFPGLQGSQVQERYRQAMELGVPSIFEHRSVVTGDWLEVRVYPTSVGLSAYYRDINERKRREAEREEYLAALREAEAKSQDLIRFAPTAIFEIDFHGPAFRTVNDAMCAMSGYSRDELLAMDPADLLHADSRVAFAERVRRGLAGEPIPDSVEYRFKTRDGHLRDVLLNTSFTHSDGVIDGALVVGYDITERKQAERERERLIVELSQSAERNRFLADLLENAVMPFAIREPDGRLTQFNRAFAELTGYSREELVEGAATVALDLTPPEWWQAEAPLLAEAVAERRPVRYEKEYVRKDGSRVPVEVLAQPVFDQAGDLAGYRSFVTDISERRRIENARRESEERFRSLFDSTTEGIALHEVVYDDDGRAVDYRVTDVNPAYESQTGLLAGDVRGRLASELYGTGEAPYLTEYARVAEGGGPHAFETYFPPMQRHFRITVTSPGRGRFATVFEDVTERKRVEETLLAGHEAAQAAEAETRRLLDESQAQAAALAERAGLAEALNRVDRLVHSTSDFDEIMQHALVEGVQALAGDAGTIEMREEPYWVVRYQSGFADDDVGLHLSDEDAPNATRAMAGREPLAIADMGPDPETNVGFVRAHRLRSVLALPLIVKDSAIGCLLVYGRRTHRFSEAEIDFGSKLSATLALAIENARLYDTLQAQSHELRARNEELEARTLELQVQGEELQAQSEELQTQGDEMQVQNERLHAQGEELQAQSEEIQLQNDELLVQRRLAESELRNADLLLRSARLLSSGLDLETVLENLAIVVLDASPHARVTVQLWDAASRTLTIAASHGHRPAERGTTIAFEQTSRAFRDMLANKSTIVTDFDALPPEVRGRTDEFASRFHLAVPLVAAGELIGALVVDDPGERRPFAAREITLLESIAAQAGAAVRNARVFEAQRDIAHTLQQNFIHALPTVPGLDLGVVATTAYEPELVGGDFSDAFVVDDTHCVALIGDVAGKGIRAAGLTETVRAKMRAFASIDPSPAFVLARTNELLLRLDPDDPHVTAVCAVLDPRTGGLRYASAGHPAPVHLSARSCRSLDVAFGPPLGSFVRPYTEARAALEPGDYLVFYTDGVSEARRDGELLGEQGLLKIVDGLRGRAAQEVADGVRDAVLDFAGHLRDDLQVVVLRLA